MSAAAESFALPAAFRAAAPMASPATITVRPEQMASALSTVNAQASLVPVLSSVAPMKSEAMLPPASSVDAAEAQRLADDLSKVVELKATWDVQGREDDLMMDPTTGERYLALSANNGFLKFEYPSAALQKQVADGKVNLVVESIAANFMVPAAATQTISLKGIKAGRNDAGFVDGEARDIQMRIHASDIALAQGNVRDLQLASHPFDAQASRFLTYYGHLLNGKLNDSFVRIPEANLAKIRDDNILFKYYVQLAGSAARLIPEAHLNDRAAPLAAPVAAAAAAASASGESAAATPTWFYAPLTGIETVLPLADKLLNNHFIVVDPLKLTVCFTPSTVSSLKGGLQKASFSSAFSAPASLPKGMFAHAGELRIRARPFVITPTV